MTKLDQYLEGGWTLIRARAVEFVAPARGNRYLLKTGRNLIWAIAMIGFSCSIYMGRRFWFPVILAALAGYALLMAALVLGIAMDRACRPKR